MFTFPEDSPQYAALLKFQSRRVMHLRLKEALASLGDVGNPSRADSFMALVGPSGVGKSVAVEEFIKRINMSYATELESDPSFVPAILVRLPAPIRGDFNWKDAFVRTLERFNEPLIRRKVIQRMLVELDGEVIGNLPSLVAEELRRALRSCVIHRGAKIIAFDEASHLFIVRSRSQLSLQLQLVKSLKNDIEIPMILAATYELIKPENFDSQLLRRSDVVHFRRYTAEDLLSGNSYGNSFRDAIHTMLHALPVEWDQSLMNHADYFLMRSVGCVGILKTWLQRALERALHHNLPVDGTLLEATAFSNYKLMTMLKEAVAGEALLKDIKEDDLARELGFDYIPTTSSRKPSTSSESRRLVKKRRPGTRKPGRDPIGGESNDL
ncbi:TniB family NTP-binding protein [Burkholderia vietnamiensis]|uniref:TniB family NTP-binding protein n=1 Tax=Burkholderia vietnamiensis TaxID=60552 RepID=UPI001CF4C17C|nr:TniB family NTP-binding protein [Burkholderia vietnamiensis]MCA8290778.1 TniB family NTP-binding protein [Burkholderia vietnamiensis]